MKKIKSLKEKKRLRIKKRIKAKLKAIGNLKPRLSIFRSNKHIYAQVVDDKTHKTLVFVSDLKIKRGTKREKAREVGKEIAKLCKEKNIFKVVFDRNGFKYLGRIKELAEAARKEGLKF